MPFDPSYLHLVFPDTTFEALLYGRASRDPKKRGDSVEDQLGAGRTLCHDCGWRVVEEFKDVGLSASRHTTRARDDFEDLLDTIEHTPTTPGVMRIVVAYEASRYYRDLDAYVRLRSACLNAGVLLCYKGTVYDLSRSDDRRATAMDAINAEGEADDIRDRNIRTAARTADAGDPHGRLLFGYAREYEVVSGQLRCVRQYEHPTTGTYVYKALLHIDQGRSVRSLIQWLNSQEEAERADGQRWTTRNVRLMLLNRAYLGERRHRGEWKQAAWEPIKGLETPAGRAMFNRVTALLSDPDRRTQRGSDPVHLLSLIALCGRCGDHARLAATPGTGGTTYLKCQEKKDVAIREDRANAFVEEAVIDWFSRKPEARAALVPDDRDVEEKMATSQRLINGLEEQLTEARTLAADFDENSGRMKLSAAALAQLEAKLLPRLEAEQSKLRTMTGVSPLLLSLLQADDPQLVWDGRTGDDGRTEPGLTLEQKREVIRKVVTVRLHRARAAGVQRIEPGRITLAFAGKPGFRGKSLRAPGSVPGADAAGGK